MTDKFLKDVYEYISWRFYDEKLPVVENIAFGPLPVMTNGRTWFKKKIGSRKRAEPFKIRVNENLNTNQLFGFVQQIMLHEAVHVRLGAVPSCERRGGPFDKEMYRLVLEEGAYADLW
jgi:hypothetical protein